MATIISRQIQTDDGPREITADNVQYWSHHTQQFAQTQVYKAKKFIEHNCYEYVGEGMFLCNPIVGYNTRTYNIKKNKKTDEFSCNCQKGREGDGVCAHVLGLYYAFRLKYFQGEVND